MKYVRTSPALLFAIGNPKNIREAVDTIERREPEMDIAETEDENTPIVAQANTMQRTFIPRQNCANEGHEAFFCPVNPCIYCKSAMHKSAEWTEVKPERKIYVICKECKLPGYTIDPCLQRIDSESYCQFCQAANALTANTCEIIINLARMNDANDSMKKLSLEKSEDNMKNER